MTSVFQPPPTYALPIIIDERTQVAQFNPIWLKWFVDLTGNLDSGGAGSGTVTSVAALTLGTAGTDLSSTVASGTTAAVITLQVPTASATNRGALSAADWTTFNNKGSGTVTSVSGSGGTTGLTLTGGPITGTGTLTLGGTLAVANGGTGSATQNWVDLTTTQATIAGAKTFTTSVNGNTSTAGTSGTYGTPYFNFAIADSFVASAPWDSTSFVNGLQVVQTFSANTVKGGRQVIAALSNQTGVTSAANGNRNYVGIIGASTTSSGDGGTGVGTELGAYFGINPVATITGGTYILNLSGMEVNTTIAAGVGTRVKYHSGIQIASAIGERGYGTDTAIAISNLSGTGWGNGILFGNMNGAAAFTNTSTVLAAKTAESVNYVFDLRNFTATTALLASSHLTLTDGTIGVLNTPTSTFLSTSSTVTGATNEGLRPAMWSFFDTNTSNTDTAVITIDQIQRSGAGQLSRTGIHVKHYSQPDNGGDVSAGLFVESGGGSALTAYKDSSLRPAGFTDYSTSPQGALEIGTADKSQAALFLSGARSSTYSSNAVYVRIDNSVSKGIIIAPNPIGGVTSFDARPAFAIGVQSIGSAADTTLHYWQELSGKMHWDTLFATPATLTYTAAAELTVGTKLKTTDLTVTNTIVGSVNGNAATATTATNFNNGASSSSGGTVTATTFSGALSGNATTASSTAVVKDAGGNNMTQANCGIATRFLTHAGGAAGTGIATFVSTTKPGGNTNNAWLNLYLDGTLYYLPYWT